jgi:hypothetical protein
MSELHSTSIGLRRRRHRRALRRILILAVVGAALVPAAAIASPADPVGASATPTQSHTAPDNVDRVVTGNGVDAASQRLQAQADYYSSYGHPKSLPAPAANVKATSPTPADDGIAWTTIALAVMGGLVAAGGAALIAGKKVRARHTNVAA